jgi:hypothetical protein
MYLPTPHDIKSIILQHYNDDDSSLVSIWTFLNCLDMILLRLVVHANFIMLSPSLKKKEVVSM